MARDVDLRMLGPLEARIGGEERALPGGKPRLLLALLLLEPNRVISSDRLIDAVWGDAPPPSARNALQVYVTQLRRSLAAADSLIVTASGGYLLALERDELDLERFERLAAEGEEALRDGDPETATATLQLALGLWRGPPLADLAYEAGLQAAIQRLVEIRLLVLERRIEADLLLGRHASLVPELEALVAEQPLREWLRAQLMLALYRSGRQADALAVFQAGRRRLHDELAIEPSPSLRQLEHAILVQEPSLALGPDQRDEPTLTPPRALLLALERPELSPALELARTLATSPPRELILAMPVVGPDRLEATSAWLGERREALLSSGVMARAAAFVSGDPGADVARLAQRLEVDLLVVELGAAGEDPLQGWVGRLAAAAPCDLGLLSSRDGATHADAVLVPFGGDEHDWAAVETGAWIARARDLPLKLAGAAARRERRDASRLLADASLAVQRALGVVAEPLLIRPGAQGLVAAAEGAALVVAGFPNDWRSRGLGETRLAAAQGSPAPVLLVRRGLRPGVLSPREASTRYTWSLDSAR